MFCLGALCSDSEATTFVLKQSLILSSVFAVIIICCLGAMKTVEQIVLDLFQNCDLPEEVSGTADSEVDLNDDAVVRSR